MSRGSKTTGRSGEIRASHYLREKGYRILEMNYSVKEGEVDIVAEKSGVLVFIEVKTRSNRAFGDPLEAITESKQERIIAASHEYLVAHSGSPDVPWQIDVITLEQDPGKQWILNHYENAFQ